MCVPLAAIAAVASVAATVYSVNQQKKAAKAQQNIAKENLQLARDVEARRVEEGEAARAEADRARRDEDLAARRDRREAYDGRQTTKAGGYNPFAAMSGSFSRSFFKAA